MDKFEKLTIICFVLAIIGSIIGIYMVLTSTNDFVICMDEMNDFWHCLRG